MQERNGRAAVRHGRWMFLRAQVRWNQRHWTEESAGTGARYGNARITTLSSCAGDVVIRLNQTSICYCPGCLQCRTHTQGARSLHHQGFRQFNPKSPSDKNGWGCRPIVPPSMIEDCMLPSFRCRPRTLTTSDGTLEPNKHLCSAFRLRSCCSCRDCTFTRHRNLKAYRC